MSWWNFCSSNRFSFKKIVFEQTFISYLISSPIELYVLLYKERNLSLRYKSFRIVNSSSALVVHVVFIIFFIKKKSLYSLYSIFCHDSVAKHLESANTMFSFIWWIIGFYWVSAGGQSLAHVSPLLYWSVITPFLQWILKLMDYLVIDSNFYYCGSNCRLCIIFLGFDVFFVVFCVALACIIGIAVCCCLPCIIALLYAVADQVIVWCPWIYFYASIKGHSTIILSPFCFGTFSHNKVVYKILLLCPQYFF